MGPLRSSLKTFVGSGSDFDNPITKLPIFSRKCERVGSVRVGSGRVIFKSLGKLLILVPKNGQNTMAG